MVFNHRVFTYPIQCRHNYSLIIVGLKLKSGVKEGLSHLTHSCVV
jgi:hypothetical protein